MNLLLVVCFESAGRLAWERASLLTDFDLPRDANWLLNAGTINLNPRLGDDLFEDHIRLEERTIFLMPEENLPEGDLEVALRPSEARTS
jgi:hypothetical protein